MIELTARVNLYFISTLCLWLLLTTTVHAEELVIPEATATPAPTAEATATPLPIANPTTNPTPIPNPSTTPTPTATPSTTNTPTPKPTTTAVAKTAAPIQSITPTPSASPTPVPTREPEATFLPMEIGSGGNGSVAGTTDTSGSIAANRGPGVISHLFVLTLATILASVGYLMSGKRVAWLERIFAPIREMTQKKELAKVRNLSDLK